MGQIHDLIRAGDELGVLRLLVSHPDARSLVNEPDQYGSTPLITAMESTGGSARMVRALLAHGAQVWFDIERPPEPLTEAEVVEILQGVYDLSTEYLDWASWFDDEFLDLRWYLGLDIYDRTLLDGFTLEDVGDERYARPGTANPEDQTTLYRIAMIRAGASAFSAREHFREDRGPFARESLVERLKGIFGRSERPSPPVYWCFARFGYSATLLPGGRCVLIGGEHEDSYDPDFYIYNDVTVFHPGGEIQVFGYPHETFEPTDFHTATLVDDHIWIIGGLGYKHQREGAIPVYRLNVQTYRIERMATLGDIPPRLYGHRAESVGDSIIVQEGQLSNKMVNMDAHTLHLPSLTWTRAEPETSGPAPPWASPNIQP